MRDLLKVLFATLMSALITIVLYLLRANSLKSKMTTSQYIMNMMFGGAMSAMIGFIASGTVTLVKRRKESK